MHVNLLKRNTKNADVVRTSLRKSAAVLGLIWTTVGTSTVQFSTPIHVLLPLVSPCVMTCRDDVGTTDPDKSESKGYLVAPNCFLGSCQEICNCNNFHIFTINGHKF